MFSDRLDLMYFKARMDLPPTSSSLKVTNRSFRYASPYLWNQLPKSFCESHPHLSFSASQSHLPIHATSQSASTPLSPITSSLFHSRLKMHLFHKSFPPQTQS